MRQGCGRTDRREVSDSAVIERRSLEFAFRSPPSVQTLRILGNGEIEALGECDGMRCFWWLRGLQKIG